MVIHVITSFLSQMYTVFFTTYTINEVIKKADERDGEKMKKLIGPVRRPTLGP